MLKGWLSFGTYAVNFKLALENREPESKLKQILKAQAIETRVHEERSRRASFGAPMTLFQSLLFGMMIRDPGMMMCKVKPYGSGRY